MKKQAIISFFLIVITTAFFNSSCKHDTIAPVFDESQIPAGVCFQDEILPMIQTNCALSDCHGGDEEPRLLNYNDIIEQVKAGDPQNSTLYKYAIGSSMPPSPNKPLNLEQVILIYGWIKQGALNNSCACDTNIYTFSGAVLPVIKKNCLACHNTGSANDELITYQDIKDKADKILKNINGLDKMMPPPPANPLSACKITQIRKWINAGKLNN